MTTKSWNKSTETTCAVQSKILIFELSKYKTTRNIQERVSKLDMLSTIVMEDTVHRSQLVVGGIGVVNDLRSAPRWEVCISLFLFSSIWIELYYLFSTSCKQG